MTSPAGWLRDRAKSYARDAETLRANGDTDDALVFEAIRDELRKCADEVPSVSHDLVAILAKLSALHCEEDDCPNVQMGKQLLTELGEPIPAGVS